MRAQGKLDEPIVVYRETIRLQPDDSSAHEGLGTALYQQGKRDEAIAAHREAFRLEPRDVALRMRIGSALREQRKLDEAVAAYRDAIRIEPDYFLSHNNLALELAMRGKLPEAISEFRESVRLTPDSNASHENLGHALRTQGEFLAAADEYRKARDLSKGDPGKAREFELELANIERMAILAARLPAVLWEDERPKDAAEELGFARLAYDKNQFGTSARLFAGAFAADPKLVEDLKAANTDLAGIRDEAAIKALPVEEQKVCRTLWSEVDRLLKEAQ